MAVGAGLILLMAVLVAALVAAGEGEQPAVTRPTPTTTTTGAETGVPTSTGPIPIDDEPLRRAEPAVFGDEEVVLIAWDGSELGLGSCCMQPSHGGGDAEDGFVFEGHTVAVYAVPFDELRYGGESGQDALWFDCGGVRYHLFDGGPAGEVGDPPVPDRALLERAARRLIPGLYCTASPMEFAGP